jgi:hypothetical protein
LAVPKFTSYEVAPIALQVSVTVVETPVEPFDGLGEPGTAGAVVGVPAVTVTLSKVEVLSNVASALQTTRPTITLLAIETVVLPAVAQVTPSAETEATNVSPLLASRTQAGGGCVVEATDDDEPPVDERRRNSTVPLGRRSSTTCLDPADNVSRIMIPAFAIAFVFWIVATRATISPSPPSVW